MSRRERDNDDSAEESGEYQHPALKNNNRLLTQAKHVAGRALKYGAIGAVAGGVATYGAITALGLTAAGGCAAAAVPTFGASLLVCGALGALGIGLGAGAAVASVATTVALYAGATGAALGGALGAADSGEAADAEEDKIINKYEQGQARSERLGRLRDVRDRQEVAMHRQEEQMRGQNPNRGLPQGRGAGVGHEGPAYS